MGKKTDNGDRITGNWPALRNNKPWGREIEMIQKDSHRGIGLRYRTAVNSHALRTPTHHDIQKDYGKHFDALRPLKFRTFLYIALGIYE